MSQLEVTLLSLHPAQRQIHDSRARFRVAACGRRFGKNIEAANEQFEVSLPGGKCWHIGPDYPTAQVHWRLLKSLAAQIPGVRVREDELMIITPSDGFIQVKSANATLRSEALDHVTFDECGYIADLLSIWHNAVRPTLTDRRGRALFLGSPNGLDGFYDLFNLGQDPNEPDWASWQLPSSMNPYIPADEIEAARKSLPARVFEQEYLAQFIADGAGVFRFVRDVSVLAPQPGPVRGHRYIFGIDFGRSNDFTAVSVFDASVRDQAARDRFTGISWAMQRQRIKTLAERWRPMIIWCEANSFGSPNIEQLIQDGLPVRSFDTTAQSKPELIDTLALAIEKGAADEIGGIKLLDDPIQKAELLAYTYQRLPSGAYRYSAPPGKHDDTVIALAASIKGSTYERLPRPASSLVAHVRMNNTYQPPEANVRNLRLSTTAAPRRAFAAPSNKKRKGR